MIRVTLDDQQVHAAANLANRRLDREEAGLDEPFSFQDAYSFNMRHSRHDQHVWQAESEIAAAVALGITPAKAPPAGTVGEYVVHRKSLYSGTVRIPLWHKELRHAVVIHNGFGHSMSVLGWEWGDRIMVYQWQKKVGGRTAYEYPIRDLRPLNGHTIWAPLDAILGSGTINEKCTYCDDEPIDYVLFEQRPGVVSRTCARCFGFLGWEQWNGERV